MDGESKSFKLGSQFRLSGDEMICIDRCETGKLLPISEWLPALFGSWRIARVRLDVEIARPVAAGKRLTVGPDGSASDKIAAGAANWMVLPPDPAGRPRIVEFAVAGQGNDRTPALLAVYDEGGKQLLPIDDNQPAGQAWKALRGGTYFVCVYFGPTDLPGCRPTEQDRKIFEDGSASVRVMASEPNDFFFAGRPLMPRGSEITTDARLGATIPLVAGAPARFNITVQPSEDQRDDLYLSVLDEQKQKETHNNDDPDPPRLSADLQPGIYFVCVGKYAQGQCQPPKEQAYQDPHPPETDTAEITVSVEPPSEEPRVP